MQSTEILIYEDEEIWVMNKPSGLPSAPLPRDPMAETAVSLALKLCPEIRQGFPAEAIEPGLLHRLDTGTSGLLAFAKNPESFQRFKRLWTSHEITKTYRAIAPLPGKDQHHWIEHPLQLFMGHDEKSSKRMRAFLDSKKASGIRGKALPTWTEVQEVRSLQSELT